MPGREQVLWGRPIPPQDDAPRRSILHCMRMLAPFREAVPDDGHLASDMAEGERQFYAFIKGLYGEMYSDPAFFLIPKEEPFQQAIRFYAGYLYQLGIRAQSVEKGVLSLTTAAWQEARKAMGSPRGGEEFQRLKGLGLDEQEEPKLVYVTCRDFPKMLYGLWALCKAPEGVYHYTNYLRVDYQSALRGQPLPGDIFSTLTPDRAQPARTLHAAMIGMGARWELQPLKEITWGSRWEADYVKAERRILGIAASPDNFTLRLKNGVEILDPSYEEMDIVLSNIKEELS